VQLFSILSPNYANVAILTFGLMEKEMMFLNVQKRLVISHLLTSNMLISIVSKMHLLRYILTRLGFIIQFIINVSKNGCLLLEINSLL